MSFSIIANNHKKTGVEPATETSDIHQTMDNMQRNIGTEHYLVREGNFGNFRSIHIQPLSSKKIYKTLSQQLVKNLTSGGSFNIFHAEVLRQKRIVYIPMVTSKLYSWKATNIQCGIPKHNRQFTCTPTCYYMKDETACVRAAGSVRSILSPNRSLSPSETEKTAGVSVDWLQLSVQLPRAASVLGPT
jgi:hypothetical protein